MTLRALWLALLPNLPGLPVLGVIWLRALRRLTPTVQRLLGGYVIVTLAAALFTPTPVLAVLAALGHGLLVMGLIAVGTRLTSLTSWYPLAWGLAVLLVISAAYTVSLGAVRLTHPVYAATSVGLGAAIGVTIAVFLPGTWLWRLPMGLTSVAALLWSGSRGAALALVLGLALGAAVHGRRWLLLIPMLGAALLLGAAALGGPAARLLNPGEGGRDVLWSNARTVIQDHPVGGVGRWLLGSELQPFQTCYWWAELETRGVRCRDLLGTAKPQVMAHNAALQTLGETGVIGALAEYLLLATFLLAAWRAREPLLISPIVMPVVMGLTDTPLLLPGPFAGALLYVVGGAALVRNPVQRVREFVWAGLLGVAILALTLLPPLAFWRTADGRLFEVRVISVGPDKSQRYYDFRFDVIAPPGPYRMDVLACQKTCIVARVLEFQGGQRDALLQIGLPDTPVELRLRVLNDQGVQARVLGRWKVAEYGETSPMMDP